MLTAGLKECMNHRIRLFVCVCCAVALPSALLAQSSDTLSVPEKMKARVDQLQPAALLKSLPDTLPGVGAAKQKLKQTGDFFKKADPANKLNSAGAKAKEQGAKLKRSAAEKIKKLTDPAPSLVLTLEDAGRYQPVPPVGYLGGSRFTNVISARGVFTAFGVPLNFNFTTDRATSMLPAGAANNLFKIDLMPGGLGSLYRSQLQQYLDVRRNLFGGMDLSAYTRVRLEQQLSNGIKNEGVNAYLNSSSGLQELLVMDKQGIIRKLQDQSVLKTKLMKALPGQQFLEQLSNNIPLRQYLSDPIAIRDLKLMTETQLRNKIAGFASQNADPLKASANLAPYPLYIGSFDIGSYVNDVVKREEHSRDSMLSVLSRQLLISTRQNGYADLKTAVAVQQEQTASRYLPVAGEAQMQEYEAVAESILSVKKELGRNGLDIRQMLAMQQYLENGSAFSGMSEFSNLINSGSPVNAAQKILGRFDALKFGAYSHHIPGGVGNQDIFLKGGHITVKSGIVPLSFGYGSVSDINALKDQGFQNSAYNQSRNVAFIGAELKQPGRGSVKLSVVSAVGHGLQKSAYSMPAISSNNVAYTLSKELRMGRLGTLDMDVSKSTTLYSNKFQPGSEALLDSKNGMQYDLGRDLFQSSSFSVNHSLELPALGASDKIYFSYAGIGYQNPANNGFGGAKMKMGGNVRKSFDRNKLTFTVRTDLGNMPISYTSDDRWKTWQFQVETRYKVNRQTNLSLNYTTNGTDKQIDGISSRVYAFQKMQLNGNTRYRIGKHFSVSNFGVGTQAISSPAAGVAQGGNSRLLLINYVQSMVIKKDVLTFNMFYNRELTGVKLIGNMLNTDLSYQYMLFGKLNMNSGLTYLENTGIIKQVGVRQNIMLLSAKSFDLGTSVDVRKDLIKPLYSALYPSCRAEINLRYHLNAF